MNFKGKYQTRPPRPYVWEELCQQNYVSSHSSPEYHVFSRKTNCVNKFHRLYYIHTVYGKVPEHSVFIRKVLKNIARRKYFKKFAFPRKKEEGKRNETKNERNERQSTFPQFSTQPHFQPQKELTE